MMQLLNLYKKIDCCRLKYIFNYITKTMKSKKKLRLFLKIRQFNNKSFSSKTGRHF